MLREFALISMWRVPALPIGAHTVLSLLAEPLKQQTEILLSVEDHDVSENLREFQDWVCHSSVLRCLNDFGIHYWFSLWFLAIDQSEYYSCDAKYRSWLKIELANEEVSPSELSNEEKQRTMAVATETLISSFKLLSSKSYYSHWCVVKERFIQFSATFVLLMGIMSVVFYWYSVMINLCLYSYHRKR